MSKRTRYLLGIGVIATLVVALQVAAYAASLAGSNFEIDTNANLKVDNAAPSIDWLAGGSGTPFRSGVLVKNDKPTGANDDSFGKGTAENNPNPTIVDGSIPPNKSDLKAFGVFTEQGTPPNGFLELFWSRVQNPSGTTNMDFELNQKFCDLNATPTNCADNGSDFPAETPIRTTGDKLITYDLSRGGTNPTISIRTWDGSVWGNPTVISGGANPDALGSINTTGLAATDTGTLGTQDPFTFGEAAISFKALFGQGACGSFGSAYLKSRSSDSFTSEIKDFVGPQKVQISNCPTALTTDASNNGTAADPAQTVGGAISDKATLGSSVPNGANGEVEFKLYKFALDATITATSCTAANQVLTYAGDGTSNVTVTNHNNAGGTTNPYTSASFTTTEAGKYQWTAQFKPAPNQGLDNSAVIGCGDPVEQSLVNNAPSTLTSTQTWVPSDSATINHGGGTVTFTLLKNQTELQCNTTNYTAADPAFVYTTGALNVPAGSGSQTVSTTSAATQPSPIGISGNGTYRWQIKAAGPTGFDPATFCKETTVLTINDTTG